MRRQRSKAVGLDLNLSREWHPTKNGDLKPSDIRPHSHRRVWWLCKRGHEWVARVSNRVDRRSGCPKCSRHQASEENNLQICYPDIARQWHPTRNGDLKPSDVTPRSHRKVWWLCERGHEWKTTVIGRKPGSKCPKCSGREASEENNLQVSNRDLAMEWHPTKNGTLRPSEVTPHTGRKVWWICERGHEWQAAVWTRVDKDCGCPKCSGRVATNDNNLAVVRPDLAKEWHPTKNGDLRPTDVKPKSNRKVWWLCKMDHEWEAVVKNRTYGSGCPYCRRQSHGR